MFMETHVVESARLQSGENPLVDYSSLETSTKLLKPYSTHHFLYSLCIRNALLAEN